MKLYQEPDSIIEASQYADPLMLHLSEKIISHLGKGKNKSLLDIGCGAGRTALMAAKKGYEVIGVDIEKEVIKLANKTARKERFERRVKFICADILGATNLKKGSFDVVVCSEVIEHVLRPKEIIKEAGSFLKSEGILILTTPRSQKLWTVIDEYAEHTKRFETAEIKAMLKSENFAITNLVTIGFPLTAFLFLAYNFFVRLFRLKHGSSWRTQKGLSSVFTGLVSLMLRIDDRFNFLRLGTNIIVVARKKER